MRCLTVLGKPLPYGRGSVTDALISQGLLSRERKRAGAFPRTVSIRLNAASPPRIRPDSVGRHGGSVVAFERGVLVLLSQQAVPDRHQIDSRAHETAKRVFRRTHHRLAPD